MSVARLVASRYVLVSDVLGLGTYPTPPFDFEREDFAMAHRNCLVLREVWRVGYEFVVEVDGVAGEPSIFDSGAALDAWLLWWARGGPHPCPNGPGAPARDDRGSA